MSWLTKFRLQALGFFGACTAWGVYLLVHGLTAGKTEDIVFGALIVPLGIYMLGRGVILGLAGRLPKFQSKDDVLRYQDERMPWLPGARRRRRGK